MSWPLRRVEWKTPHSQLKPGDWWIRRLDEENEAGQSFEFLWSRNLSPEFRASGRDYAVFVHLPGGASWPVDFKSTGENVGWSLQIAEDGTPWTASPSIDAGVYHGWLQNGALTDDCEGRTFS